MLKKSEPGFLRMGSDRFMRTFAERHLCFSGGVVATGYHVDGPENLLIQLTGTKAKTNGSLDGWNQVMPGKVRSVEIL